MSIKGSNVFILDEPPKISYTSYMYFLKSNTRLFINSDSKLLNFLVIYVFVKIRTVLEKVSRRFVVPMTVLVQLQPIKFLGSSRFSRSDSVTIKWYFSY